MYYDNVFHVPNAYQDVFIIIYAIHVVLPSLSTMLFIQSRHHSLNQYYVYCNIITLVVCDNKPNNYYAIFANGVSKM